MKVMVDTALPDHRKLYAVAESLKIPESQAAGHILFFWCRVMNQSPAGDLKGWTPGDIARAGGWRGDANQFKAALLDAGFIRKDAVHDWIEHQGDILEKREQWRSRWKRKRERDSLDTSRVNHGGVTGESRTSSSVPFRSSSSSVPSPSLPSHTPPREDAEVAATPPASVRSDPAGLLVSAYCSQNKGVISFEKCRNVVEFYLSASVSFQAAEAAIMNGGRGRKIWEILEPLRKNQNGQGDTLRERMKEWLKT